MSSNKVRATDDAITGGCFCGGIRYRASGHTGNSALCHCRDCQHQSGAPMVAWTEILRSDIEWSGAERGSYENTSDWRTPVRRTFCRNCGTTLTYERQDSDCIDVAIVTLDEPDRVAPDRHVYVTRRRVWVHMNDGLPEFETLRDTAD